MLIRILVKYSIVYICQITLLAFSSHVGFADTGKSPDPRAAKRGAKLYATYCQSCHGKNGEGEPEIPASIQQPGYFRAPAMDESEHAWHHSDEDLVKFILNGSPRTKRMAAFKGVLTTNQARDIVAFIKSLWGPRILACQGPKHMSCPH